ncbi:hypothetical protein DIPPA_05111 [Diplonema papillatum]|nr:hypothetical protein DIPPA_05111 [Diplonema papillatum]
MMVSPTRIFLLVAMLAATQAGAPPSDAEQPFCYRDSDCAIFGDTDATCLAGTRNRCSCSEGFENPAPGEFVAICVPVGVTTANATVVLTWDGATCDIFSDSFEAKVKMIMETIYKGEVQTITHVCGSLTVFVYIKDAQATKLADDVLEDVKTVIVNEGLDVPFPDSASLKVVQDVCESNNAKVTVVGPNDQCNAIACEDGFEVNRQSSDETDALICTTPVTTEPPAMGEPWCKADTDCRVFGDAAATCTVADTEVNTCACSNGFENPNGVGICVSAGTTTADVVITLIWEGNTCSVYADAFAAELTTVVQDTFGGAVEWMNYVCGSLTVFVHLKGADTSKLNANLVDVIAQKLDDEELKEIPVKPDFVQLTTITNACSLDNAVVTALDVDEQCSAIACEAGLTVERENERETSPFVCADAAPMDPEVVQQWCNEDADCRIFGDDLSTCLISTDTTFNRCSCSDGFASPNQAFVPICLPTGTTTATVTIAMYWEGNTCSVFGTDGFENEIRKIVTDIFAGEIRTVTHVCGSLTVFVHLQGADASKLGGDVLNVITQKINDDDDLTIVPAPSAASQMTIQNVCMLQNAVVTAEDYEGRCNAIMCANDFEVRRSGEAETETFVCYSTTTESPVNVPSTPSPEITSSPSPSNKEQPFCYRDSDCAIFGDTGATCLMGTRNRCSCSQGFENPAPGEFVAICVPVGVTTASTTVVLTWDGATCDIFSDSFEAKVKMIMETIYEGEVQTITHVCGSLTVFVYIKDAKVTKLADDVVENVKTVIVNQGLDVPFPDSASLTVVQDVCESNNAKVTIVGPNDQCNAIACEDGFEVNRQSSDETDALICTTPVTTAPPAIEEPWCKEDTDCRVFGDAAATCTVADTEVNTCACSNGFENPNGVGICVSAGTTTADVVITLIWEGNTCSVYADAFAAELTTVVQDTFGGAVEWMNYVCGSLTVFVHLKGADTSKLNANLVDVIAQKLDDEELKEIPVKPDFVQLTTITNACSLDNAVVTALDVDEQCSAIACADGFKVQRENERETSPFVCVVPSAPMEPEVVQQWCNEDADCRIFGDDLSTCLISTDTTFNRCSCSDGFASPNQAFVPICLPTGTTTATVTIAMYWEGNTCSVFGTDGFEDELRKIVTDIFAGEIRTVTHVCGSLTVFVHLQDADASKLDGDVLNVITQKINDDDDLTIVPAPSAASLMTIQNACTLQNAVVTAEDNDGRCNAIMCADNFEVRRSGEAETETFICYSTATEAPSTPAPLGPLQPWCSKNDDCRMFGDEGAVCTLNAGPNDVNWCSCTADFQNPSSIVRVCLPSGETTLPVVMTLVWNGDDACSAFSSSLVDALELVVEGVFGGDVEDVSYVCGSLTVFVHLEDAEVAKIVSDALTAINQKIDSEGLTDVPKPDSVTLMVSQEVCELEYATVTAYDASSRCNAIACADGYEVRRSSDDEKSTLVCVDEDDDDDDLSGGAIAGIVIGCVLCCAILAAVIVLFVCKKKKTKNTTPRAPDADERVQTTEMQARV